MFNGNVPLTLEAVRRLEISKTDDIPAKFLQNWSGGIVGLVTLELSNDNRRVQNGNFLVMGKMFSNKKAFSASKFWDVPNDISIVFTDLDTSVFSFSDSMSSDLADREEFDYAFTKDGKELNQEEEDALKIPGFTLRAYIAPLSGERAKINIVLYPLPQETLLNVHMLTNS